MEQFPKALEALVHELSRLPTVGRKSAQRLALYLLKAEQQQAQQLARALVDLHANVHFCRQCFFLAEEELCAICKDHRRDHSSICVVEEPADVIAFERSGTYRGLYHVLLGRLSPLQGVMPDDLKINELVARLSGQDSPVAEVILATSPSVDGDATALYLHKIIEQRGIKTTRLGLGVPMGSNLEYIDELTLQKAMEGRRNF
jgi:recombination protein RecR